MPVSYTHLHEHKIEIDPTYFTVLKNYIANMKSLLALCDRYRDERKGRCVYETESSDGFMNEKTPIIVERIADGVLLVERLKQ